MGYSGAWMKRPKAKIVFMYLLELLVSVFSLKHLLPNPTLIFSITSPCLIFVLPFFFPNVNAANSFSSYFLFRLKIFILLYQFSFFSLAFDKCLILSSFSFLTTPFSRFANLRAFIILSSCKIFLLSWNFILVFLSKFWYQKVLWSRYSRRPLSVIDNLHLSRNRTVSIHPNATYITVHCIVQWITLKTECWFSTDETIIIIRRDEQTYSIWKQDFFISNCLLPNRRNRFMGEYNDSENDNGENATQKPAERQEHVKDFNNLTVWIIQNVFSSSNMTMRDCLPVAASIKNQHLLIFPWGDSVSAP